MKKRRKKKRKSNATQFNKVLRDYAYEIFVVIYAEVNSIINNNNFQVHVFDMKNKFIS